MLVLMQNAYDGNIQDNSLAGKRIAVLGLAFKANTDDVRYSPSITVIKQLLEAGMQVCAYDPAAADNMKEIFPAVMYAGTPYEALDGADACLIMTEWAEFKNLDLDKIKLLMKGNIIVDMRGIFDRNRLSSKGFLADSIGV